MSASDSAAGIQTLPLEANVVLPSTSEEGL